MKLTPEEIEHMRVAGGKLVEVMAAVKRAVKPGITPAELDQLADKEIRQLGALPSFHGYQGYPAATCISVNEQIIHCIPDQRPIQNGDVVSVDLGLFYQGVHVDAAISWPVGQVSPAVRRLLDGTYAALLAGTEQVKPGNRVGDISKAIGQTLKGRGLTIFRQFVGHGVGRKLHEEPIIANHPTPMAGPELVPGKAIALEPIAGLGEEDTVTDMDGWSVRSADNKPAAHFEHTVLITPSGHEVMTPLENLIGS